MAQSIRKLAVVTGASTGIGYELAKCAALNDYDLVMAANEPEIEVAGRQMAELGAEVVTVQADLATPEGVDELCSRIRATGRRVDVLMANAGVGGGGAFLDQSFDRIRQIVNTNVTGTLYLIHQIARDMRENRSGRILITGSIAGFMPGTFQAAYNGTKAFLNNFAFALRHELRDHGVTVTCLMPGATETEFFERADLTDTKVGQSRKDDPEMVAKAGFEAMLRGEGDVVTGWKNKIQSAISNVLPSDMTAEMHRRMAEPGSGKH